MTVNDSVSHLLSTLFNFSVIARPVTTGIWVSHICLEMYHFVYYSVLIVFHIHIQLSLHATPLRNAGVLRGLVRVMNAKQQTGA